MKQESHSYKRRPSVSHSPSSSHPFRLWSLPKNTNNALSSYSRSANKSNRQHPRMSSHSEVRKASPSYSHSMYDTNAKCTAINAEILLPEQDEIYDESENDTEITPSPSEIPSMTPMNSMKAVSMDMNALRHDSPSIERILVPPSKAPKLESVTSADSVLMHGRGRGITIRPSGSRPNITRSYSLECDDEKAAQIAQENRGSDDDDDQYSILNQSDEDEMEPLNKKQSELV